MQTRIITNPKKMKLHGATVTRIEANRIGFVTEVVLTLTVKNISVEETHLLCEMPDKIRNAVNDAFKE